MSATESERKLRATIAAHESWANTTDRAARTAPARRALDDKFLAEAGGDPVRGEHLKKAYFARLALKSAKSRRLAREARDLAAEVETELGEPPGSVLDLEQTRTGQPGGTGNPNRVEHRSAMPEAIERAVSELHVRPRTARHLYQVFQAQAEAEEGADAFLAWVITYADPTGEKATDNVLWQNARGMARDLDGAA